MPIIHNATGTFVRVCFTHAEVHELLSEAALKLVPDTQAKVAWVMDEGEFEPKACVLLEPKLPA